jgi:di/tricarboxylate transporter
VDALSWQAWLTLAVVVLTVVALARDLVAPALALMGANIFLLVSGVITVDQALSGFSNPAPMTVAALFVVARAVEKTGALQPLISGALGNGGAGARGLARLLVPAAGASAFLNNTPIVAMLAPQVADWADKRGQAASRYLMPLSFATMLGGTLTAIGTSTNLVVSGLMEQAGMAPIGMFEITRVGLPVAIVGLVLLVGLGPLVLPDRRTARQKFTEDVREYVLHGQIAAGGPLDGQTVEAAGLRHLQGVFLAEVQRGGQTLAPAAPSLVLQGGDRLAFVGRVDQVRDLQRLRGLVSTEQKHAAFFDGGERTFFEVVISAASPLVGKTLKEAAFRSGYQAAVLAIHRAGERVRAKLGEVRLKEGDTLLLISDTGFAERWRDRSDFLLVSHLGGSPPSSTRQAWFVGAVTLGVVLVAGLGLVPILHAALVGAVALVLGRVLTASEARSSIELDVLVVIAASFGLGAAISASGLAAVMGRLVVDLFHGLGPIGVLFAVTLAAAALTEVITNNAAAVLLFPIATAAATEIGADPRPFAIALAVAASASFLTPIGYQTNTMVYGLGGYRFGDYARLGAPLNLLVIVVILLVVPIFWPF